MPYGQLAPQLVSVKAHEFKSSDILLFKGSLIVFFGATCLLEEGVLYRSID